MDDKNVETAVITEMEKAAKYEECLTRIIALKTDPHKADSME